MVFVCHAVINVRSFASDLQGIRKSIADEVAQVAERFASMSILIASIAVAAIAAIAVIVAMIAIRYFQCQEI